MFFSNDEDAVIAAEGKRRTRADAPTLRPPAA